MSNRNPLKTDLRTDQMTVAPVKWQDLNGENLPGFAASGGVRPSFVFLAGAFPSAKVDAEYWAVLAQELADVPEPVLHAAVRHYVRVNENAYRLPTVAELLRLSRRAGEKMEQEVADYQAAARDDYQQEQYDGWMRNVERVLSSIPQADWQELQARITAAYEETGSLMDAYRLIFSHLVDAADAPEPGWYCPTERAADRLLLSPEEYKTAYEKPVGDGGLPPLDEELVQRMTMRFPGKFRVRYQDNLRHLLNPDAVA